MSREFFSPQIGTLADGDEQPRASLPDLVALGAMPEEEARGALRHSASLILKRAEQTRDNLTALRDGIGGLVTAYDEAIRAKLFVDALTDPIEERLGTVLRDSGIMWDEMGPARNSPFAFLRPDYAGEDNRIRSYFRDADQEMRRRSIFGLPQPIEEEIEIEDLRSQLAELAPLQSLVERARSLREFVDSNQIATTERRNVAARLDKEIASVGALAAAADNALVSSDSPLRASIALSELAFRLDAADAVSTLAKAAALGLDLHETEQRRRDDMVFGTGFGHVLYQFQDGLEVVSRAGAGIASADVDPSRIYGSAAAASTLEDGLEVLRATRGSIYGVRTMTSDLEQNIAAVNADLQDVIDTSNTMFTLAEVTGQLATGLAPGLAARGLLSARAALTLRRAGIGLDALGAIESGGRILGGDGTALDYAVLPLSLLGVSRGLRGADDALAVGVRSTPGFASGAGTPMDLVQSSRVFDEMVNVARLEKRYDMVEALKAMGPERFYEHANKTLKGWVGQSSVVREASELGDVAGKLGEVTDDHIVSLARRVMEGSAAGRASTAAHELTHVEAYSKGTVLGKDVRVVDASTGFSWRRAAHEATAQWRGTMHVARRPGTYGYGASARYLAWGGMSTPAQFYLQLFPDGKWRIVAAAAPLPPWRLSSWSQMTE
jgi:hypothetical protein